MKKINRTALAVIAVSTALGLSACTAPASVPDLITVQQAGSSDNVISVQASEKVKVVPDITEIIFAVSSQADNPKDCKTLNSQDLDKVLKLLESQGVDSKSIQTSNYGLNPIYDWSNGQTITGYEMSTDITVSDLPLDKTGELISACVDAGVNNIKSVSYLSSKYDEAYGEALQNAVKAAREKATAIAAADGRSISAMTHVEEMADNQQVRYTGYQNAAGARKEMGVEDSIAVSPGQLDVEARITVEFTLQ